MSSATEISVPCLTPTPIVRTQTLGSLATFFTRFQRWMANRLAIRNLKDMEVHMLDDIGLRPQDVEKAAASSLVSDPMQGLISARKNPLRGRRHA